MKKNVITIILSVIIVCLGAYITYDKVFNKAKNCDNGLDNIKVKECEKECKCELNSEVNQEDNEKECECELNNEVNQENNEENDNNSEREIVKKIFSVNAWYGKNEYLKLDGINYYAYLSKDGKLSLENDTEKKEITSDIIFSMAVVGACGDSKACSIYLVSKENKLYEYSIQSFNNKDYSKITHLDKYGTITDIINFYYGGPDKGGCQGLLVVNQDKYTELNKVCH